MHPEAKKQHRNMPENPKQPWLSHLCDNH